MQSSALGGGTRLSPPSPASTRSVIRVNRIAYEAKYQHDLESTDAGRIALMRDEELVGIYDDANAACEDGLERYGSGNYSIVRIGAEPLGLGIFTFARLISGDCPHSTSRSQTTA